MNISTEICWTFRLFFSGEGCPGESILGGKRNTTRYMTKYERARVLGTRALQVIFIQRK